MQLKNTEWVCKEQNYWILYENRSKCCSLPFSSFQGLQNGDYFLLFCTKTVLAENNTRLGCSSGKYHCTADLKFNRFEFNQTSNLWAVVVAQLVEHSLLTTDVCGSNPVIGKIYIEHYCELYLKDKNKEKEAGNGPFKNQVICWKFQFTKLLITTPLWCEANSVNRLGDLLPFGQLFKAFGNNYFTLTAYIFCKVVEIFHFSSRNHFRQLLYTFGNF